MSTISAKGASSANQSSFRRDATCARDAEDDGWVVTLGYDGSDHHSFLAILRADTWEEIARLHLPFHISMGLHASFASTPPCR